MTRSILLYVMPAAVVALFCVDVCLAQYRSLHHAFSSGSGVLKGSEFRTELTVGQPLVGQLSGDSYRTGAGFWPVQQSMLAVGVSTEDAPDEAPHEFGLEQNYPNPFNPTTRIRYRLPHASDVRLTVYDLLGREVAVLVHRQQEPGRHEVEWDGRDAAGRPVATGLYLYRLATKDIVRARTMTFVK